MVRPKISPPVVITIALIIRLMVSPLLYHGDINTIYWWGKFAHEFSLRGYYDWLEFGGYNHPDQPMIMIYYTLLVRLIYQQLHSFFWFLNIQIPLFPSQFMTWFFLQGNQWLLKIPFMLADIVLISLTIIFIKKHFPSKYVLYSGMLLAFYLPLIYNSALWGSGDSLINLLGLLSVYLFYNRLSVPGILLFLTSILIKPSLLVWTPILAIIFIKSHPTIKSTLLMFGSALLYVYLIAAPFAPYSPLIWFSQIMTTKILPGVMPQLTSNAMNLWALLYGLTPKNDDLILFSLISARILSIILFLATVIFICYQLYRQFGLVKVLTALAAISLSAFSFLTRMHERYTFPALIPLFILCFYHRKYFKFFIILSVTHMLNIYRGWSYPPISFLITLLETRSFYSAIALTNIIITIIFLYDISRKS